MEIFCISVLRNWRIEEFARPLKFWRSRERERNVWGESSPANWPAQNRREGKFRKVARHGGIPAGYQRNSSDRASFKYLAAISNFALRTRASIQERLVDLVVRSIERSTFVHQIITSSFGKKEKKKRNLTKVKYPKSKVKITLKRKLQNFQNWRNWRMVLSIGYWLET